MTTNSKTFSKFELSLLKSSGTTPAVWVCWKITLRDGKETKMPINPMTGDEASTTDGATWGSLEQAVQRYREHADDGGLHGIGRVLVEGEGIVGIDLDDCRDEDSGAIADWASTWIERLDSYTEISPSGTGLKIFVRGRKPGSKCRNAKAGVEIYEKARFFAVTGNRLTSSSTSVEHRQEALEDFYNEFFGIEEDEATVDSVVPAMPASALDDEQILAHAETAANGNKFKSLWDGHSESYGSSSEADMALCSLLAFWTKDAGQIDRLFRRSKLYREKWDSARGTGTYGSATINAALAFVHASPVAREATHPYYVGDKGNVLIETVDKKTGLPVLVNVTEAGRAVVEEVVQSGDLKRYRGRIINGEWLTHFELPASVWSNRGEFCKELKGRAGDKLIFRTNMWEHLAQAAERLCPDKKRLKVTPFGWTNDFKSFFGVNCVIEKDGVKLPIEEYFRTTHRNTDRLKLAFPQSDQQTCETLRHIKGDLMHFNSHEVMQYVLSTVFIAPFSSLFRERANTINAIASLIIQGTSGDGKTTSLMLGACFFGQVRECHLASLASTPRSINDLGTKYRDALYVIDDLKWSALSHQVQEQIKGICQAYADGHARDRLSRSAGGEWEPETGKEILGTLAMSAEDLPTGEASFFGRFMVVHVKDRKSDPELLGRCIERSKDYSAVMSAFIHWFLQDDDRFDNLLRMFDAYRLEFERAVPHNMVNTVRVCSQLALNLCGYSLFLQFAGSKGVFDAEEITALVMAHKLRLLTLRDERLHEIVGETPAHRFIEMVKALVVSGKCRLEDSMEEGKVCLGFEEDGALYLLPAIAYAEVQRAFDPLKERIPFSQASLGQQLKSGG